MKSLSPLAICVAATVLLSACSSTGPAAPVENRNQPGAGSGPASGTGLGTGNGIGVTDASRGMAARPPAASAGADTDSQGRIVETPVGKSVYFDYNQFAVKAEYLDMLQQVSATVKGRNAAPIKLEGNADERGSSEYNLALGQKRAEAVKKQLELLGVPEAQLEAVSLGSEKPRETCHAEKCWAANRRVDLMRQGR
ncbi:OmpA family protein [Uliginosibacterium sp. H3]|uniref:Peptidoglycan-associated lipoprotein n=1 Tax=Uliginosibacterium silvisoli TaxID=3114758 RepID=A0ABU6K177_9RHOO|nr:OmpA family protein [Uliginosibacterium sp. H3]